MFMLLLACRAENVTPLPEPTNEELCTLDGMPQTYTPTTAVTVQTDSFGVRHLYGATDADVVWAQGYAQATDRLFQLEINRRSALGTLAEVRGESARVSDIQARTIGFERGACEALRAIYAARPDDYLMMVAFAEGISARVAEVNAGTLPEPFVAADITPSPWTVSDVMATGRRLAFGYSNTLTFDLLYSVMLGLTHAQNGVLTAVDDAFIMGETPPAGPVWPSTARGTYEAVDLTPVIAAHRAHAIGQGSNSWGVSGQHTATGTPLLANDPHAGLQDPSLLYLVHLDSMSSGTGSFDTMGFGFVGFPFVQLGHTRTLAWGATTNFADVVDLWDVPTDGVSVFPGGETVALSPIEETLRVRQDDGSFVEETVIVNVVPGYGVLLTEDVIGLPTTLVADGALLMNWNGFEPITDVFLYTDLDRAATLDDFEAAALWQTTGIQNFAAATAEGWRYYAHGSIPDRGPADARARANRVLDGSDASTFWTGEVLPDSQLPRLSSAEQDFFQTANQDPWGHSADGDPTNDAFYYGGFYDPGFRGGRARDELETLVAAGGVTPEAMMALQMDTTSALAVRLVPVLEQVWAEALLDPDLFEYTSRADLIAAVARLSAWDRQMRRDSTEAALFRAFHAYLGQEVFSADLNILFYAIEQDSPVTLAAMVVMAYETNNPDVLDSRANQKMLSALSDALAWAGERTYGEVHQTVFSSVDGSERQFPTDGDEATLNVSQCSFFTDTGAVTTCLSSEGAVFRQVTTFEGTTPVWWVTFPFGLGDDGTHWTEGAYQRLPFSSEEVDGMTVSTESWGG